MFDKIYAARLTVLVNHLENAEKLAVGTFRFTVFRNLCSTAGCAIGEASALWKRDFMNYCNSDENEWCTDAQYLQWGMEFFGLSRSEFDHMFIPNCQMPMRYGGKQLNGTADRYEVAANIRSFLEFKGNEDEV